jgi:hypothetical protein
MSKITEASRDHIADENFAFPKERKEPIHDAVHVRNAIARFKQVQGVTDAERDAAWKRIKSAAKKHKVELNEQDWRELSQPLVCGSLRLRDSGGPPRFTLSSPPFAFSAVLPSFEDGINSQKTLPCECRHHRLPPH